jgi:TPR repeat protein
MQKVVRRLLGRLGVLVLLLAAPLVALADEKADLAAAYARGDHPAVRTLAEPLAAAGDADAQAYLGDLYFYGRGGLPESNPDALEWYRRSAAQDNGKGQYRLG